MEIEKFRCLIVGSRSFTDYDLLSQKAKALLISYWPNVEIVSGGAKGADALAKRFAFENSLEYTEFPADWDAYGKSAGYIRNTQMHEYISQAEHRGVIAFWDGKSKGPSHNFELAEKYSNQLKVFTIAEGGTNS